MRFGSSHACELFLKVLKSEFINLLGYVRLESFSRLATSHIRPYKDNWWQKIVESLSMVLISIVQNKTKVMLIYFSSVILIFLYVCV
jgi:hypothetical protein